jgi:hypothetical protein
MGSNVTFTATAKDPNNDQYYLAICKTDAITAGDNTAPTCNDGAWAITPAGSPVNSSSVATVTYNIQHSDVDINNWYAFVCDKVALASGPACFPSAGDQGLALGTITLTDIPSDGATVTVDGVTYEFDTNNNVTLNNVRINISGAQTGAECAGILASADSGTNSHMIAKSNVVYIYANTEGSAGNSIAMAKAGDTGSAITLSGVNLTGGNDANASPFYVNQTPIFGTVTVTNTNDVAIKPGDTLKFKLPQGSITAGSNINMYICSSDTTNFNYDANSCTGGSMICSVSNVDPNNANAVCTGGANLIAIPTAHGDYGFKVYVKDSYNLAADGANSQTYTVTDVPPTLVSYTTTDTPAPLAGGSDTMDFKALIQDDNGEADITAADGSFFDSNATQNWTNGLCASDELKCFNATSCALNTAIGDSSQAEADCSVTMWFNANASTGWKAHINATDQLGKVINFADSDGITNPPLSGIDVIQSGIAYGSLAVGGTSSLVETSIGNVGNQAIDVLLNGNNMCTDYPTCSGYQMPAGQQKWYHTNTDFNWDDPATGPGPYALVNQASSSGNPGDAEGCLNMDIAVRTDHASTSTNESIWWKIKVPATQHTGSYSGQNTFSSASADTCTGGVEY